MLHNLLEKLQLRDEKNLLIQGLPSSIEKQFAKLTFAKNITPLLRARKIDFALVFAVNETQLANIINEIMPAMRDEAKLWVAYPKLASKIATTLNRDCSWKCITCVGYESVDQVTLDHVWTALRFQKTKHHSKAPIRGYEEDLVLEEVGVEESIGTAPKLANDFARQLKRSKAASHFFDKLSLTDKKEYESWVASAKKQETRSRRLETAIDKLIAGKKTPTER